jgi:hypothetical protein
MGTQLNLTRVQDYEFLGLYSPNDDSEIYFYVYDMKLEDGTERRCFYSSQYGNVLMKGDVVEYELQGNDKMKIRIPKKKTPFLQK